MQRKQHGGHKIPLTDQQYHDLCVVQMADWLEQVQPSPFFQAVLSQASLPYVDLQRACYDQITILTAPAAYVILLADGEAFQ